MIKSFVDIFSHITWYTTVKHFFLSHELNFSARWRIDRSLWWRSFWRRRIWWTRRGTIASKFLVLVILTLIYLKMTMMNCFQSFFTFPLPLVTWKGCVEGQLPHCLLMVAWQRLQGSNLSFSHYFCLTLFGPNNRDAFLVYLIQNLNFINQPLGRFDKK